MEFLNFNAFRIGRKSHSDFTQNKVILVLFLLSFLFYTASQEKQQSVCVSYFSAHKTGCILFYNTCSKAVLQSNPIVLGHATN